MRLSIVVKWLVSPLAAVFYFFLPIYYYYDLSLWGILLGYVYAMWVDLSEL